MYSDKSYRFAKFMKSKKKDKKYTAILIHRVTGRRVQVHFGGIRSNGEPYYQYADNALGLYKKYDHKDSERRRRWLIRHAKDGFKPYSASYFSRKYLW